jgi:hypothetical protein
MKVAAYTIAYNEHRNIKAWIKQFPEWVEEIVVLASERPWFGPKSGDECKMLDILASYRSRGVKTIKMFWPKEHEQRSWGAARLSDYDWVITLDPDEFLTPEDWEKFRDSLESCDKSANSVIPDEMVTYWKDFDHCWDEEGETHRPVIALRPLKTVFWEKREVLDETRPRLKFKLHHLSWVKSDDEVWQKINNYSHSMDFDLKDWFENVWKKWEPDSYGLMPLKFPKDVKARQGSVPDSIRSLFDS